MPYYIYVCFDVPWFEIQMKNTDWSNGRYNTYVTIIDIKLWPTNGVTIDWWTRLVHGKLLNYTGND